MTQSGIAMAIIVNVHEAKTRLSRLIEEAHAGQEIILAKAGKPYARLMPLAREPARRQPGRLAGTAGDAFFEQLSDDELDAWDGR
ncbi:MAG TPA: type II toxin-antitoxin system prevent-host-death family antitoxin [Burkholderiaceae bacterium]|nr:type II toxin-antitoxin system prevent-host-death family antitoxin [Burkholderiaceae bacterium]